MRACWGLPAAKHAAQLAQCSLATAPPPPPVLRPLPNGGLGLFECRFDLEPGLPVLSALPVRKYTGQNCQRIFSILVKTVSMRTYPAHWSKLSHIFSIHGPSAPFRCIRVGLARSNTLPPAHQDNEQCPLSSQSSTPGQIQSMLDENAHFSLYDYGEISWRLFQEGRFRVPETLS